MGPPAARAAHGEVGELAGARPHVACAGRKNGRQERENRGVGDGRGEGKGLELRQWSLQALGHTSLVEGGGKGDESWEKRGIGGERMEDWNSSMGICRG